MIGVAIPEWNLERLQKRATDSIKRPGGIDNKRAFQRLLYLLSLLKYVSFRVSILAQQSPSCFGTISVKRSKQSSLPGDFTLSEFI
jgi:uncharacterized protein YbbK (DUF523 family)